MLYTTHLKRLDNKLPTSLQLQIAISTGKGKAGLQFCQKHTEELTKWKMSSLCLLLYRDFCVGVANLHLTFRIKNSTISNDYDGVNTLTCLQKEKK